MKSTVQRALWAFTLKATVLRHPLPPAPMAATESEPEQPKVKRWDPAPFSTVEMPGAHRDVLESRRHVVDAYIAATAGEPGELGYMKEFQRLHLGEPSLYKGGLDLAAGDDKTVLIRYSNPSGTPRSPLLEKAFGKEAKEWVPVDLGQGGMHQGGWRIVGEGGPELVVTCPRRAGKASLRRRAFQHPMQEIDEFWRQVCAALFGVPADTEGGSCD